MDFPTLEACLNAASAVLLTSGYLFIRRRRIGAHKACMLSAFGASTLFLVFYVWNHLVHGVVHFRGHGWVRGFYFALLGSHSLLAVVIVPLVLVALYRAWRRRFPAHRRVARWALPLWLYVSVTGVVVYWMLYHLYRVP